MEYIRRPITTATILLCLAAFALPDNLHHIVGKCLGKTPCTACKTCAYGKHCNEGGSVWRVQEAEEAVKVYSAVSQPC